MSRSVVRAVELHGRVGNQLFQYAMLRALQGPEGPVLVEAIAAPDDPLAEALRPGAFRRLTSSEAWRLRRPPTPPARHRRDVSGVLRRLPGQGYGRVLGQRLYREVSPYHVDPGVRANQGDVLFRGFFQHEGYFRNQAQLVLDSFARPSNEVLQRRDHLMQRAQGATIVAVVVRAGLDYEQIGWGVPLTWYQRALDRILQSVDNPYVLVSSDVPLCAESVAALCRRDCPAEALLDVTPAGSLFLLSAADHVVTAATTFGWWAAWVGDARRGFPPDRQVVVPDPWCVPGRQIAPDRWNRLAVDDHGAEPEHP